MNRPAIDRLPFSRPLCPRLVLVAMALAVLGAASSPAAEREEGKTTRHPVISPGEKAQVSLFGIQAEGYKFVYVLDRSGSMGGSSGKALAAAKAELIASLEGLDTVHQFQIIFYNERPRIFNPTGQPGRLAFGNEQNKRQARNFINSIVAEGGTAHEDAIVVALRMRPDVIFLLTDADDPKLSARQMDRMDRIGAGVIINTIEFGSGPQADAENFLVKLARQSGGKHAYVDTTKVEEAKAAGPKEDK